jgi:hypothetical protein
LLKQGGVDGGVLARARVPAGLATRARPWQKSRITCAILDTDY